MPSISAAAALTPPGIHVPTPDAPQQQPAPTLRERMAASLRRMRAPRSGSTPRQHVLTIGERAQLQAGGSAAAYSKRDLFFRIIGVVFTGASLAASIALTVMSAGAALPFTCLVAATFATSVADAVWAFMAYRNVKAAQNNQEPPYDLPMGARPFAHLLYKTLTACGMKKERATIAAHVGDIVLRFGVLFAGVAGGVFIDMASSLQSVTDAFLLVLSPGGVLLGRAVPDMQLLSMRNNGERETNLEKGITLSKEINKHLDAVVPAALTDLVAEYVGPEDLDEELENQRERKHESEMILREIVSTPNAARGEIKKARNALLRDTWQLIELEALNGRKTNWGKENHEMEERIDGIVSRREVPRQFDGDMDAPD